MFLFLEKTREERHRATEQQREEEIEAKEKEEE
jgi:hypothetical protein